jgi:hypothetical protein
MKKIYEYPKTPEIPKPKVESKVNLKEAQRLSLKLKAHPDRIYTFSTERTPDQLKILRQRLIDGKFISDNITEDQFIYIFTEQLVVDYMVPIKWKIRRGGKTALKYFLELLFIPIHKNQVSNCFIDADGKPFLISKPNRINGNYGNQLEKICNF